MKISYAKWRAYSLGLEVTKAPFVIFSVSKIFVIAKVPLRLFESHLYLTGATAAPAATPVKYRRDIQYITCVLILLKNSEKNGMEKIALVTPSSGEMS